MEIRKSSNGSHYSFSLSGKFTFSDHSSFKSIIDTLKSGEVSSVSLDLSNLDFVDSAALGMLLIAREEAEKNNMSLTIIKPTGQIDKMFKISKFDTLFNIEY